MPRPETPALTVDVIIETQDAPDSPIVLIERRNPPPGWALPGGFVDVGETVENAAVREAREETGLSVELIHLLGVYSDPQRDPRGHTVSVIYIGHAFNQTARAGDDAANVALFGLDELPQLAFDHADVLSDYVRWKHSSR